MPHQFERTERTRLRRMPERASYDAVVVEAILAEGLYCHVGFSVDGQPYVIPTIYAHIEDRLLCSRFGCEPDAAYDGGESAGLRHGYPAGRSGAGPFCLSSFDELSLPW